MKNKKKKKLKSDIGMTAGELGTGKGENHENRET